MNKIQDLVRAFGQGKATAAEVVAAAKAADVGYDYAPADTYDEMARRVQTDESAPAIGWDDVTLVYFDDGLTDEQYSELSTLYENGGGPAPDQVAPGPGDPGPSPSGVRP